MIGQQELERADSHAHSSEPQAAGEHCASDNFGLARTQPIAGYFLLNDGDQAERRVDVLGLLEAGDDADHEQASCRMAWIDTIEKSVLFFVFVF